MSSVEKEIVSKHEAMIRYFQSGLTDGNEEFHLGLWQGSRIGGFVISSANDGVLCIEACGLCP